MIYINKILFFSVFIISLSLLSCAKVRGAEVMPHAVRGVFQAGEYDPGKDGPVDLRGDWKFRWLEDDPVFEDPDYDDSSWPGLAIRGYWTKLTGKGTGYGWYRLHVRFNGAGSARGTRLGLSVPYIKSSYDLYINGNYAASSGNFGRSIDEAVPQVLPRLVMIEVPAGSGEILIAVRCSNFHHREGGFFATPQLGLYDDLRQPDCVSNAINSAYTRSYQAREIFSNYLARKSKIQAIHK